jgi:predicted nucleic acid-binding protein
LDGVIELAVCLDTSVLIKWLIRETPEEDSRIARELVRRALTNGRLIAPSFSWAEVGSTLRKKTRQSLVTEEEASEAWELFLSTPIEFVNDLQVRDRAWLISVALRLPTLYDASFLACCEIASLRFGYTVELLTADQTLIDQVRGTPYSYVKDYRAAE